MEGVVLALLLLRPRESVRWRTRNLEEGERFAPGE